MIALFREHFRDLFGSDEEPQPEPEPAKVSPIAAYLGEDYERYESFHNLYVSKDLGRVLLEPKKTMLDTLFFHNLTFEGREGMMPSMWDETPKAAGLHFAWAPNGQDIQLVEAQERLGKGDFAASMYDTITGGMLRGYIDIFTPLAAEEGDDGSLLLDLTQWLFSFAQKYGSGRVSLIAVKAFPKNFLLRFSATGGIESGTEYWTAGFCVLPEEPMVPRPFDRRVGYFTTPILVGGAQQATVREHVIHRWNLQRRGGKLLYCIDPAVPKAYHETLKNAVEAWNKAFDAAGLKTPVLQCVAAGDAEWPDDYSRGDARFIAIHMTDPHIPVLGYGPSVVDFRSGEILSASVLLGFRDFLESASQYSLEVLDLKTEKLGCGGGLPMVDADHADVLRTLLKTTIHEVGHTLGLRHNFIASEDGHSSVMEYEDPLDTSDPSSPRYGGYFRLDVGTYDIYAIRYGYTPLPEVRGEKNTALFLLANGQGLDEPLAPEPRNPLFATDENVTGSDPRVQRWYSAARRFGRDKLEFAVSRRKELLDRVKMGSIFPETYSRRVMQLLSLASQHVLYAINFVGGTQVDARRVVVDPCTPADMLMVVHSVVELVVGPLFRLSAEESRHFLMPQGANNVYSLEPVSMLAHHSKCCDSLFETLLSPSRLQRLELMRQQADDNPESAGPDMPGVFDLVTQLAFEPGHNCASLLHPLNKDGTPCDKNELARFGRDPLRAEARQKLGQHIASLRNSYVHASVRGGIEGFVATLRRAEKNTFDDVSEDVAAPWLLFLREIDPVRQDASNSQIMHMFGSDLGQILGDAFAVKPGRFRARGNSRRGRLTLPGDACLRFGCRCGERSRL